MTIFLIWKIHDLPRFFEIYRGWRSSITKLMRTIQIILLNLWLKCYNLIQVNRVIWPKTNNSVTQITNSSEEDNWCSWCISTPAQMACGGHTSFCMAILVLVIVVMGPTLWALLLMNFQEFSGDKIILHTHFLNFLCINYLYLDMKFLFYYSYMMYYCMEFLWIV